MKNTINKIILGSLLTSVTAFSAADNTISITGTVTSATQVKFQSAIATTPLQATEPVPGVDVALGSILPGSTLTAQTLPIYIKTNNTGSVTMQLTDATNSGNIKHATETDTIPVSYTLMGSTYTIGAAGVQIASGVEDGTTSVGDLVITPSASAPTQKVGVYNTVLTVIIANL